MRTARLATPEGLQETPESADWRAALGGREGFFWLDVRNAGSEEMEEVASQFHFHDVCVESCLNPYSRPTLHQFQDHICMNMTLIGEPTGDDIVPEELHVFVGGEFIVTVTNDGQSEALDALARAYTEDPELVGRGTLYAMYLIAQALVDSYMPLIEKLDEQVDELEQRMMDQPDKSALRTLFALKRRLFDLRRLLGPQRDVFTELARRQFRFASQSQEVYFNDLYSRMIYLFDVMDTVREALSNALDIYLSATSNRLNEIMKVLTVAAAILMTLSLITGFYGMNFVRLPWLSSPHAFRNSVLTMTAITAVMLYLFRRKGWL